MIEDKSGNERIWELQSSDKKQVTIQVFFHFLTDDEWTIFINKQLELFKDHWNTYPEEKEKIQIYVRGCEWMGTIYIKESARKDDDFRYLILHELGHAVCNLDHSKVEGSIMHSNYKKWYK